MNPDELIYRFSARWDAARAAIQLVNETPGEIAVLVGSSVLIRYLSVGSVEKARAILAVDGSLLEEAAWDALVSNSTWDEYYRNRRGVTMFRAYGHRKRTGPHGYRRPRAASAA